MKFIYLPKGQITLNTDNILHIYWYFSDNKTLNVLLRNNQALANIVDSTEHPYRSEKASLPAGSWSSRILTNVRMPEPRMLISDQKIALPGVAEEDQKKYIARLEEDDAPF